METSESSKTPVVSFLILILSIPVIAIVIGGIISIAAYYWNYSTIIAIAGICAFAMLSYEVLKHCKIKSSVIAILYVIILGLSVFSVHVYGDYRIFIKSAEKQLAVYKNVDAKVVADKVIEEKTGKTGLWGFLNYETKVGIVTKTSGEAREDKHVGADAWIQIVIDFALYELGAVIIGGEYAKDIKKKKKESAPGIGQ